MALTAQISLDSENTGSLGIVKYDGGDIKTQVFFNSQKLITPLK